MTTGTTTDQHQGLTDRQAAILAFERKWWKFQGAKDQAIRETFGVSATRYYQELGHIIEQPAALEVDAMVVRRIKRLREARREARSARRLGSS